MSFLPEIAEMIEKGRKKSVEELVRAALEANITPEEILNEGLLKGMNSIGEKFKNNEVFVPEVMVAARAMNSGIDILKPHLNSGDIKSCGTVVIGTVKGDLHDIGKNLVKVMMEGKGIKVVDLGTNVAPEAFVDAAIENNAEVICCSALLTTTMAEMKHVVECMEEKGIRSKVKIMIGGAPVSQKYCESIGADAYTSDAATAADMAKKLCAGE